MPNVKPSDLPLDKLLHDRSVMIENLTHQVELYDEQLRRAMRELAQLRALKDAS